MTGREIYDVMEQLNPTKQQEEKMYQNILSSSAGQEYIENRGRKKAGFNRKVMGRGAKLRYAAAVILFLLLAPTITYAVFHSAFLEKFDINQGGKDTQDEEWLAQYVKEELATFSYGGYLFQLQGCLMNAKIGEGMLIMHVKKERETDYRLSIIPEGEVTVCDYTHAEEVSMDLSKDKEYKGLNLSKIIQFQPDAGNEMQQYRYACSVIEEDSYEYRITLYSDYQTISKAMQQPGEKLINLNFYDGTGELIGKIPIEQKSDFVTYHWLSPSRQNNVVLTPFSIYATGVPGQMAGDSEGKIIVTYKDGRKKEIENFDPISYTAEYNEYKIFKLNTIVNTNEVESLTIHTKDRDWYLDVKNAQEL